jgi:hypothetical protein
VPDTVIAEPPGTKVVPATTTNPEGFTESVVPATTAVGDGEAGAGLAGFWFWDWFGAEFGLDDPWPGVGDPWPGLGDPWSGVGDDGSGLLLTGAVDVEDGGTVNDSGVVLGPPGEVIVGDGDAEEEGVVWSAAGVIGEKNPGTSCKDSGGSKTPWKATPQVAQAGSKALTPPGIWSCGVQRLVCTPRRASDLHFLVHVHRLRACKSFEERHKG